MPERRMIYNGRRRKAQIVSDAHAPDVMYVHTVEHDDDALDQNARIRSAGLLRQDSRFGLHDDSILEYAFSIPSVYQWGRFKREHPEIAKGLHSANDEERRKAARSLAVLKPQWLVSNGKL